MEAVLETLSNETKTIIRIYKACLEDLMKKDLEIKLKEKELEMKSKENELEKDLEIKLKEKDLEMKSKENELEKDLEIKLKEKDLEMKSKEIDLVRKLNNLKYEYARHNWEDLKVKTKLNIRSVLELFESKRLDPSLGMSRFEKCEKFANEVDVIDDVRSSDFTPTTFADTVVKLYENLNKAAHPIFQDGDTLMVQEEYLSESEWRVLSLIWKLYPLPEGKIQKTKIESVTT